MKTCTDCKQPKNESEYHKDKHRKDGFRIYCKNCAGQRSSDWSKTPKGRELGRKRDKKRYQKLARKKQIKEAKKRYLAIPENRIKEAEQKKKYKPPQRVKDRKAIARKKRGKTAEGRSKNNAIAMKRHASKLKRTPSWLNGEHWKQIRETYLKAVQMTEETGIPHEVDHIVPLQGKNVSGLHVPWNLQILTASENSTKGNKF